MIELIILGTACMQPTKKRNHIGILLSYQKENILFDCGEGIQRQLRLANFKPAKITKVFLSHWHGDHVLGLPGLMNSMGADQAAGKLQIYGPKGTKRKIEYMMKAFASRKMVEYEVKEIIPKEKEILTFSDFSIEAWPLEHGLPCLGYGFVEKDKRKIKAIYIKKIPGILLGRLQQGKEVEYQGQKIAPEEATYLVKGKKITVILDTRPCNSLLPLAQEADLLILEATYLEQDKEKAEEYFHMTVKEAAFLANRANAKKLVLLHFSPRYKEMGEIREEAKQYFKEVVCAEDFMRFKV